MNYNLDSFGAEFDDLIYDAENYNLTDEEIYIILTQLTSDDDVIIENDIFDISCEKEKIHNLQYEYHYHFYKENKHDICVSIASGIDYNDITDYDFEGRSIVDEPLYTDIIDDIEIDWKQVLLHIDVKKKSDLEDYKIKRIEDIFEYHKADILEIYKKENYDNYMTGGGTTATNDYYNQLKNNLHSRGFYWKLIYKTVEVDRRLV
jgi:hypothetical protein